MDPIYSGTLSTAIQFLAANYVLSITCNENSNTLGRFTPNLRFKSLLADRHQSWPDLRKSCGGYGSLFAGNANPQSSILFEHWYG